MLHVAFIDIFYGVGGGVRTASFMVQTLLHHGHHVALLVNRRIMIWDHHENLSRST